MVIDPRGSQIGPDVGLTIDVVSTDVVGASLRKGQIKFKLPDFQREGIGWQFEIAAHVHEPQVGVAQASIGICARDAEIVVNPESDIAAEIPGSEDAEITRLKVRSRNVLPGRPQVVVVGILTRHLEELIKAQPDRRESRNRSRKYSVRPQFLLRRRSQHHLWDLDKVFIIFRKLEAGILEGLAKIVELGKVNMAGGARGAVLARESRDGITASCQQYDGEDKS